jgi:HAD superfamily hydrolase (TIGR01509 family)
MIPLPQEPKAVIFDMDGVLYDTMKLHTTAWLKVFERFNTIVPAREIYLNEGRTSTDITRLLLEKYGKRSTDEKETSEIYALKNKLMNELPRPSIQPGIQQLIDHLHQNNCKTMVVTGSRQESLLNRLQGDFGFKPEQIVSGNDYVHGKPHPEPYQTALNRLDMLSTEVVVIENAPLGIISAKTAQLYTIAVNTGILNDVDLIEAGADVVYSSTEQLTSKWENAVVNYTKWATLKRIAHRS